MIAFRFHAKLDFKPLDRAKQRAERRYLYRAAGYTRTTMRRSMPKRKGKSPPGRPPHTHKGRLRAGIRFAVESDRAVIGPIREWSTGGTAVPGLLERGGTVARKRTGQNRSQKSDSLDDGRNWKLKIGGHGPRRGKKHATVYIRIRTAEQLRAVVEHIETATEADLSDTAKAEKAAAKRAHLANRIKYDARPFAGPSLKQASSKFPEIYAGAFK